MIRYTVQPTPRHLHAAFGPKPSFFAILYSAHRCIAASGMNVVHHFLDDVIHTATGTPTKFLEGL